MSSESHDNIRKRVGKACDRCRLKKSKCDGASPCSRCKTDNTICVFGERKKSHDKVYPKGYVEQLEQNQKQLTAGLRELYSRLQRGERWDGPPLAEATGGYPLTHDILDTLGVLTSTAEGEPAVFEEDFAKMQEKLEEKNGLPSTRREGSISEGSGAGPDADHSHRLPCQSYGDSPTARSTPSIRNSFHSNMAQTPPSPLPSPHFPPHHPSTFARGPIKQQPYTFAPQTAMANPSYDAQMISSTASFEGGIYGEADYLGMGDDYPHPMFSNANPFIPDAPAFPFPTSEFELAQHGQSIANPPQAQVNTVGSSQTGSNLAPKWPPERNPLHTLDPRNLLG